MNLYVPDMIINVISIRPVKRLFGYYQFNRWFKGATPFYSSVTGDLDKSHHQHERAIRVTPKAQYKLVSQRPSLSANQQLLKVAIIGAPNAGKSTLINKLVGWKVAPVSRKVHTTRSKTLGVLTEDEKQVVFLDTPGIIVPNKMKRHNLELSLLVDPHLALMEADLVLVLVDVSQIWHRSHLDPEILKLLHLHRDTRSVLVLNKVDLIKRKERLLSVVRELTGGSVGNSRNWSTIRPKSKRIDIESLFTNVNSTNERSEHRDEVHGLNQSDLLDIRQICDRLVGRADDDNVDDSCGRSSPTDSEELKSHYAVENISSVNDSKEDGLPANKDSPLDKDSQQLALYSDWKLYFQHLQKMAVKNERGWPHFDAVFMISAVQGDGIFDIRNYLLDHTYQSRWLYSQSVVTDQNPIKLAKLVIRERLLDHLTDEIPYAVKVKLSLWEVGEDNLLRAAFDIVCFEQRHLHQVLGRNGETIRCIAAEAKQELMNVFRREMTLKLVVRAARGVNVSRPAFTKDTRNNKPDLSQDVNTDEC